MFHCSGVSMPVSSIGLIMELKLQSFVVMEDDKASKRVTLSDNFVTGTIPKMYCDELFLSYVWDIVFIEKMSSSDDE